MRKSAFDLAMEKMRPEPSANGTHQANGQAATKDGWELVIRTLAGRKARPVRWLVSRMIPVGKVVMFAGVGGMGKSTIIRHAVACLTTGRKVFGLDYVPVRPVHVLIATVEDDPEDTIIPHLIAEGADLSRVHTVEGEKKPDGATVQFDLRDLDLVRLKLEAHPQIRVLVIDPIMSFIGRAGLNENSSAEVKTILDPLLELAHATGITVILIAHLNKGTGTAAVNRVAGSIAFRDTCRLVYAVGTDPHDGDRRVMAVVKANVPGLDRRSLAFTLEPLEGDDLDVALSAPELADLEEADLALMREQLSRVVAGGHVDLDADAALGTRGVGASKKAQDCASWLKEFLERYAYPSSEIVAAAKRAGFAFAAVKEAKAILGRNGTGELVNHNYGGGTGKADWWSGLGPYEGWTKRPGPSEPAEPAEPAGGGSAGSEQTEIPW